MTKAEKPSLHYPLGIISDIHIGMHGVRAALLCEFLQAAKFDRLIINGDLIDGYRLSQYRWRDIPEKQKEIFDALNRLIDEGTDVIYMPGNHDEALRDKDSYGLTYMGVRISGTSIIADPAGRRFLVTHGDVFDKDAGTDTKNLLARAYEFLITGEGLADRVTHGLLGKHFALASDLRLTVAEQMNITRSFEKAAIASLFHSDLDGIICGHIHHPAWEELNGKFYGNSGDWLEHCSALIADQTGKWQAIDWRVMRKDLGITRGPEFRDKTADRAFRPQTEQILDHIRQVWKQGRPAVEIRVP
jgi:UDP-2,3-diacylglucosamine pyrophosphatase LpxH